MTRSLYRNILLLFLFCTFFIVWFSKNIYGQPNNIQTKLATGQMNNSKTTDNPFLEFRKFALEITPKQLGIEISEVDVYGVIMDWNLGNGVMTLVTFKTGDASMYFSTGGGVIGGGTHENISKIVKSFLDEANKYLIKTIKVDSATLPAENCIKFYFLTQKGKLCVQEQMKNFENQTSIWLDLFNQANRVITELRLITEKKE